MLASIARSSPISNLSLQLESIHRVSQTEWKTDVVLPSVSFAPLILPSQESVKDLEALEICKATILVFRNSLFTIGGQVPICPIVESTVLS